MVFAFAYQLSSGLGQRHTHMFGASTETIVARRVADLRLENRLSNVRDGMMCFVLDENQRIPYVFLQNFLY